MTNDIKQKISEMQSGNAPTGYIKTTAGVMPVDWNIGIKAKKIFANYTDKKHNGDLEILAATQESGIIPRRQIDIDIKCSEEGVKGYKKVEKGNFVISLRSFQGGIEYSNFNGIVSPAYTVLKSIQPISDEYYKNYFKTDSFIKRLNGAIYGIRDGKQIGYEDFSSLVLHNPPFEEQQKIAEILMQCDKVIELKKKRIEEETLQKQALLKKILLNDNWKQYRLRELCDVITDGDWIESKDQSNTGIRLIQTGNIGVGRYLEKEKTAKYISNNTFKALNCTEVFNGDVLVSRLPDPIGRACMINNLTTRAITAVDCTILKFKERLKAEFFLQYATTQEYFNKLYSLSGGSTRTRISRKELENLRIKIPDDKDKLKQVIDILKQQDDIIRILEEDLEQWQQKKKSLMQLLLTGIVRCI